MIRTGGITQLLTAVRLQIHGSDLWSSDMCGCIPVSLGVCGQRAAEWAVSLHFELSTWTPTAGERIHASAVCDNFWHMTVPDWSVAESDLHYHEQNRERLFFSPHCASCSTALCDRFSGPTRWCFFLKKYSLFVRISISCAWNTASPPGNHI